MNKTLATLLAIAVFSLSASWAGAAEAPAAESGSVLYVVAPGPEAARKANLLPYEATLRTVAIVLAGQGQSVRYVPREQLPLPGDSAYPRIEFHFGESKPRLVMRDKADGSRELARADFRTESYEELVSTVSAMAGKALVALGKVPTISARPPGNEDAAKLAEALESVVKWGPSGARMAAGKIEEVMAKGSSAAALRAAALPSACLASIDLYGFFQYRDRGLAVPLSFVAAARLAEGPKASPADADATGRLSEAWVALVCGFPAESLRMVEGLGDLDGAHGSLATALEVWALRDWPRYAQTSDGGLDTSKPSILEATAVEQMAWVWAIQYCGVFESHDISAEAIFRKRNSAGFAPLAGVLAVGTGRRFTPLILSTAFRDAIYGPLTMSSLPLEKRRALVERYTGGEVGASEEEVGRRARSLSKGISDEIYSGSHAGEPGITEKSVRLMWQATDLPLAAPSGPTVEGRWQVLEPWYVAQVYRGVALQSVQLRVYLLQKMWVVPEDAKEFIGAFSAGTGGDKRHGLILKSLYFWLIKKQPESAHLNGIVIRGEIGVQPYQWYVYSKWWSSSWLERTAREQNCVVRPIGAFQSALRLVSVYLNDSPSDEARMMYTLSVKQDPASFLRAAAYTFETDDSEKLLSLGKQFAASVKVLRGIARKAVQAEDWKLALPISELLIENHPQSTKGYSYLAQVHEKMGEKAKAIDVLKECVEYTEPSVGQSHAEASLVDLLLDEDRIEEAVEHGRHASGSGSSKAVTAYAKALIADGQIEEGLEYYRKNALRYASSTATWRYLSAALKHGLDARDIYAEAEMLYLRHRIGANRSSVIAPFIVYEAFDAARDLVEGVCNSKRPGENERFMGIISLVEGDFEKAARYFAKGTKLGFVHPHKGYDAGYSVFQACIAMTLAGDVEGAKKAREVMGGHRLWEKSEPRPLYEYAGGKLTREEALEIEKTCNGDTRIELYWIFGAEEEAAGNIAAAVEYYTKGYAIEAQRARYSGTFYRRRLKHFGKFDESWDAPGKKK